MYDHEARDKLVNVVAAIIHARDPLSLNIIIDTIPVMISYIDENETYLLVNKAYCEFSGFSIDEIIGERLINIVGKEAYFLMQSLIKRALKGEFIAFRKPIHHQPTNKIIDIQGWMIPDRNQRNKIIGFIGVYVEVMQNEAQS